MNKKQLKYFNALLEGQLELLLSGSCQSDSDIQPQNHHDIKSLNQIAFYRDQIMKLRIKSIRTELERNAKKEDQT